MKLRWLFALILLAPFLMAQQCSDTDKCKAAQDAQARACAANPQDLQGGVCMTATAAVKRYCGPAPAPTPVPTPTPQPTPLPTPQPTPTPSAVCSFPQGVAQGDYREGPNPQTLAQTVDDTLVEMTGCAPRSDCVLGQSDPQFYLSAVIGRLRAKGLCAGQHIDGETDQLSVARSCEAGVIWENYQVVNYGNPRKVRWLPGSAMSGWIVPKSCGTIPAPGPTPTPGPQPTPTPTPTPPPPGGACPTLTDLKMKVHSNNPGSAIVDVTPRGPDCARCASINKGCDAGVCPLGPEGTPEFDAQRIECERLFGPYVFRWNGALCGDPDVPCFHQDEQNPLTVKVLKSGTVSVASRSGVGNSVDVVVP